MTGQVGREGLTIEGWAGSLSHLSLDKRQMEWAQMLCDLGSVECFTQIHKQSPSSEMAIMEYRRHLHDICIVTVEDTELCNAFKGNNDKELHNLLQNLFLEVITDTDYRYTVKCIDGECKNLQTIYNIHNKNKGLKLRRVLMKLVLL